MGLILSGEEGHESYSSVHSLQTRIDIDLLTQTYNIKNDVFLEGKRKHFNGTGQCNYHILQNNVPVA